MDCPKCGHQQRDDLRCESCGIYFEKYRRQQTAGQSANSGLKNSGVPPESGFFNTIKIVAITSAVIGLGLFLHSKPDNRIKVLTVTAPPPQHMQLPATAGCPVSMAA